MPGMIERRTMRVLATATATVTLFAACQSGDASSARSDDGAGNAPAAASVTPAAAATGELPPRIVVRGIDLTGVGHDLGNPQAPVVMVEFSDFGCQYCAKHARETFPALEKEYIQTGKVFYKYVPFVIGMFPNSDKAARSVECAGEQGKFWPMHDSVYANQSGWKRGSGPDALLMRLAGSVVPDARRWASCYSSDRTGELTRRANVAAGRFGVRATPTFVINGQLVEGALPLDVMRQGLDQMLGASPAP